MLRPDGPISFGALRLFWRQAFAAQDIETAALDARWLLCAAAQIDQAQLIAKENENVPAAILATMDAFGQRRLAQEPVARILGKAQFFGRDFGLNADCLVPRPDTEVLVERALEVLPADGRFIDLGTGTGCIAISILAERADARGTATDIADGALAMTAQNAKAHGVYDRLDLVKSDWFSALPKEARFDVIVSNPPYIAQSERSDMNREALDFDPELALFAADEGMAAYHQILAAAKDWLLPDRKVLFEIGFRQAARLEIAAQKAGATQVTFFKDLSGHNRVAQISW